MVLYYICSSRPSPLERKKKPVKPQNRRTPAWRHNPENELQIPNGITLYQDSTDSHSTNIPIYGLHSPSFWTCRPHLLEIAQECGSSRGDQTIPSGRHHDCNDFLTCVIQHHARLATVQILFECSRTLTWR